MSGRREPIESAEEAARTNRGSARSLLLSILGEFVLPNGASTWTATLISALGLADVEERAARQAIARSASSGWLVNEKVGRQARWHLSTQATHVLSEGTQRIYGFGRTETAWDQRWLLLFLTVPETRRELRYRLKVQLGWAGFATTGTGVWVSPWAIREAEACRIIDQLGLGQNARTFVGPLGRLGEPRSLVSDTWDLATLSARYDEFVCRHRGPIPGTPAAAFAALTSLVHHWRRFPSLDPGLPQELLPDAWSGRAATAFFHQKHDELAPLALQWWQDQQSR